MPEDWAYLYNNLPKKEDSSTLMEPQTEQEP